MAETEKEEISMGNASEIVTIITMYRGWDAEMFVQAVRGKLSTTDKEKWRKSHKCGTYHCANEDVCDDHNDMFFLELIPKQLPEPTGLNNIDGELYPGGRVR